jgi:hypothetical protein
MNKASNWTVKAKLASAVSPFRFFLLTTSVQTEALIAIAQSRLGWRKRFGYKFARKSLYQMKAWAKDCCPENVFALTEGFVQDAALALELAGNYVNRQSDSVLASEYWKRSQARYTIWGATAKTNSVSAALIPSVFEKSRVLQG